MVKLSGMVEKPKQEEAPSNLAVMGRYVLTPEIFEMLETQEAWSWWRNPINRCNRPFNGSSSRLCL